MRPDTPLGPLLTLVLVAGVFVQDLTYMEEKVQEMQTSLESDLSPRHWTIMFHLMKHMPSQVRRWGPVRSQWMFPYESLFGHVINTINNRNHFVASMLIQEATKLYLNVAKALIDHRQLGGK